MSEQVPVQAAPEVASAATPSSASPLEAIQSAAMTLAQLVETLQAASAAPTPDPVEPAVTPEPPAQPQEGLATPPRKSILKTSPLWTMLGTVTTLLAQDPLGLHLAPITQVCITALAGLLMVLFMPSGKSIGA